MSTRATSMGGRAQARQASRPRTALRRVRRMCIAVAIACAIALPFELGLVRADMLPFLSSHLPAGPNGQATLIAVMNYPKTAVIGHTELFTVQLSGMANQRVTYVLQFPNARQIRAYAVSDGQGRSRHIFTLTGYTMHAFRETALVFVTDASGKWLADEQFALQER